MNVPRPTERSRDADILQRVKRSPELVGRHERDAWLALFHDDATIEDPVGGDVYATPERRAAFWDVFIAPNKVKFISRRDFVQGDVVTRWVRISTITPIDAETPLELPAILEYRASGERFASMRAFWETRIPVIWHARRGPKGLVALMKHGASTTRALGVASAIAFAKALRPSVSRSAGRALAEKLAASIGRSRADWLELVRDATVRVGDFPATDVESEDAMQAWECTLSRAPALAPKEVIVAGDHLACILGSDDDDLTAAVLARLARGRIVELRICWA